MTSPWPTRNEGHGVVPNRRWIAETQHLGGHSIAVPAVGGSRRAWDLDAASSSGSRRLAAGVSGLLYYFHIYFLRLLVFRLF